MAARWQASFQLHACHGRAARSQRAAGGPQAAIPYLRPAGCYLRAAFQAAAWARGAPGPAYSTVGAPPRTKTQGSYRASPWLPIFFAQEISRESPFDSRKTLFLYQKSMYPLCCEKHSNNHLLIKFTRYWIFCGKINVAFFNSWFKCRWHYNDFKLA